MYSMEDHKYLPPKFSYAMKDMAKHYDVFEKMTKLSNLSKTSSNMSFRSASYMNENHEEKDNSNDKSSLRPIKESMRNKSNSRNKYRNNTFKHSNRMLRKRIKRNGSSSLPPANTKSSSRSRSRSRSSK